MIYKGLASTISILLVVWFAYWVFTAYSKNEQIEGLYGAAIYCETNKLLVTDCKDLIKFAVAPTIFISDKAYRTAIHDKASKSHITREAEHINALDKFTHLYAADNGITLPDSYTSRWPEP